MAYQLQEINHAIQQDAQAFVQTCDAGYQAQLETAADAIAGNLSRSPVVLLSGPSGSGKTTTAMKLEEVLTRRGIRTHAISMDNYFKTIHPETEERTPEGDIDLESPNRLDMELLLRSFQRLAEGKTILIPKFEFTRQMRNDSLGTPLKLGKDEVAIFEGIHALNPQIAGQHSQATALYVSARSNVLEGETLRFKGTWMRIARRAIRDYNFRGHDLASTLSTWYNVRRGEKQYISPYKGRADVIIDSSLGYEVPLFANYAQPLAEALKQVEPSNQRYGEYGQLIQAFGQFQPLNPAFVPQDSLLREFIGGGIYGE